MNTIVSFLQKSVSRKSKKNSVISSAAIEGTRSLQRTQGVYLQGKLERLEALLSMQPSPPSKNPERSGDTKKPVRREPVHPQFIRESEPTQESLNRENRNSESVFQRIRGEAKKWKKAALEYQRRLAGTQAEKQLETTELKARLKSAIQDGRKTETGYYQLIDYSQEQILALETEIQRLNMNHGAAVSENRKLLKEYDQLKEELAGFVDGKNKEYEKRAKVENEFRRLILKEQEHVVLLEEEIRKIDAACRTSERQKEECDAELRARILDYDQLEAGLKREADEKTSALDHKTREFDEKSSQYDLLEREIQNLRRELWDVECQVVAGEEEKRRRHGLKEDLAGQLHQSQARFERYAHESEAMRAALQAQIDELGQRAEKWKATSLEYENQVGDLKARVIRVETEKEELAAALEEQTEKSKQQITRAETDYKRNRQKAEEKAGQAYAAARFASEEKTRLQKLCEDLEKELETGRKLLMERLVQSEQETEKWKKEAGSNMGILHELKIKLNQIEKFKAPQNPEPPKEISAQNNSVSDTTVPKEVKEDSRKETDQGSDSSDNSFTLDILRFFE